MPKEAKAAPDALRERLSRALESKDAAALEALSGEDLPKDLRKELKRAVHRLRSQGVQVELPVEKPAAPARAAAAPGSKAALRAAFLSAVDGTGGRVLWIIGQDAGEGVSVLAVYFDDERGLREVNPFRSSRRRAREMQKELLAMDKVPVAEIPPDYARALLEGAESLSRALGEALPENFSHLHGELARLPAARALSPHPAEVLAGSPGERDLREAASGSVSLLETPPLSVWGPGTGLSREIGARIEQIESSTVIVHPAQRLEQMRLVFERTAREQMEGEGRARWARRLLDSAWILGLAGRGEDARRVARLGLAVRDLRDEVPPFVTALLRRPFEPYLRHQEAAAAQGKGPGSAPPAGPEKGRLIIPGS